MINLRTLSKEAIEQMLSDLVEELDKLDSDDFFGTEGWRKFLDLENKGY